MIITADDPVLFATIRLPESVRDVRLFHDSEIDVALLVRCSKLERVILGSWSEPIDLTALRDWAGGPLRVELSHGQRVVGTEDLPDTVQVLRAGVRR
ncbi:hypothetical protein AB0M02_20155 [Actinoplanes sp. NPDC051861]|uniref:hypothetical protein n=1 Tax=Actinoplanes sp. NPDC051861 TaxID=3155170 RepID=UPI00341349F8